MRLWLIYTACEAKRNAEYINFYFKECKRRNVALKLVIKEEGIDFSDLPDAAVVRVPESGLSERLEKAGVKVYNNSFLSRIANDKRETYKFLSRFGAPLPETYIAEEDFTPPFYPIVLKPAFGKGGRDVCMIKSPAEFDGYKKRVREPFIAQRPVSDLGRDLRIYVVGNRIIASMLRVSKSDFRSNFCLGGSAEVYNLTEEERREAEKIISLFDVGCAGFDFMFDKGRLVFNEIEDVVGSRMLYINTDIDIVKEYIDFILSDFTAS